MEPALFEVLLKIRRNWLAVLLVSLLISGALAYAYTVTPAVVRETSKVSKPLYRWGGVLNASAVVAKENPIWSSGERVSLPIYPLDVTPVLEPTLTWKIYAKSADVNVTAHMKVLYYVSYNGERLFEKVYNASSASGRNGVVLSIPVNVSDVVSRIEADVAFLKLPRFESGIEVKGDFSYSGTVEGKPVSGSGSLNGNVKVSYGSVYTFTGDAVNGTGTYTETVTFTRPVNRVKRTLLLGGSVLALALAIVALVLRFRFNPSPEVVERVRAMAELRRYGKWISTGKLPESYVHSPPKVEFPSLGDLVETAIDHGKRVIHDPERGLYFFVDGGVLYIFSPKS
ncbi:DUF5305 family protein [Thermococcus sp. 9N3]|uniref:DUF5305 family protein n=1 Tax=Thermococcus sp. 9N3 TaxID=163002 RepID=UPI00143065EB|nr:DUF5305 family protein [Thermococcus sp. 9N3]NJE49519.1 hypothetical protein [Thermococcus sp. 9N3]